jgi:hypothetical protein
MNTIETLKEAITLRKPISYEYNKSGKTTGQRIGNPYVVFVFTAQDRKQSTKLHIVQTAGVSDSDDRQPLPSFRTHEIEWLSNVTISEDQPSFTPNHPDYNPDWEKYDNVIARV